MTEEKYRINPILSHIIDDFISDGLDIDKAFNKGGKMFNKIPKKERVLTEKSFTCPKCKKTFETEKE